MNTPAIHPTAVIDPRAELAADVRVGPYVVIEGAVKIGAGTNIRPHAHLIGPLVLGEGNDVGTSAVLGDRPQHLAGLPELDRTGPDALQRYEQHRAEPRTLHESNASVLSRPALLPQHRGAVHEGAAGADRRPGRGDRRPSEVLRRYVRCRADDLAG